MANVIETEYRIIKTPNTAYIIEYRVYKKSFFGLGDPKWSSWDYIGTHNNFIGYNADEFESRKMAKKHIKFWHKDGSKFKILKKEIKQ